MRSQSFECRENRTVSLWARDRERYSWFAWGTLIILGAAFFLSPNSAAAQNVSRQSIDELANEVAELAKAPETQEEAVKKFRELMQCHQENERVLQRAYQELSRASRVKNDPETAIRLTFDLFEDDALQSRVKLMKETMTLLQETQSETIQRIYEERREVTRRAMNVPAVSPEQKLVDAILQRDDADLRDQSLAKLKELLSQDSNSETKRSALMTLSKVRAAKFDHDSFYPLISPLLKAEDHVLRQFSVGLLPAYGGGEQDLTQMAALTRDSSVHVRKEVGGALIHVGNGQRADIVIPALMELMQDPEEDVIVSTVRSMWGQYSSAEFDQFLVDLSLQPRFKGYVVYHCLSTMPKKSQVVCERLVEVLDDPDWNNSGRAAWGLTYGVTREAEGLVEKGLLNAIPEETNPYTRGKEFRALLLVATEASRELMQSIIDSDLENEESKAAAKKVLDQLDQKR